MKGAYQSFFSAVLIVFRHIGSKRYAIDGKHAQRHRSLRHSSGGGQLRPGGGAASPHPLGGGQGGGAAGAASRRATVSSHHPQPEPDRGGGALLSPLPAGAGGGASWGSGAGQQQAHPQRQIEGLHAGAVRPAVRGPHFAGAGEGASRAGPGAVVQRPQGGSGGGGGGSGDPQRRAAGQPGSGGAQARGARHDALRLARLSGRAGGTCDPG